MTACQAESHGRRQLIHRQCECELLSVKSGPNELDWDEPVLCAVGLTSQVAYSAYRSISSSR